MKKINSTLIFMAALVLLLTGNGNTQYKLNIGNFWIYSGDITEWKISIIDTCVLFDSVLYYEYSEQTESLPKSNDSAHNNGNTNQYFIRLREDSLFEKVILYNAGPDTVIQPYHIYKENAQLGDKWIYWIRNTGTPYDTVWAEVVDVFDGYMFGNWKTIKKVTYWTGLTDASRYFCDDFGLLSEEVMAEMVSILRGCYIDGVAYGDTSFTVLSVAHDLSPPTGFNLAQNYPNPFNPTTSITYSVPKRNHVKLIVYDIKGAQVATIIDELQAMGTHTLTFDALKYNLSSGIYFYSLVTDNLVQTKKLVYLK